jgi:signal transduction protein with GAF and PtsI domain
MKGKGGIVKKNIMNYETLLKVTKALSMSKDPKEIIRISVESVSETLDVKGCALYLVNEDNNELELASSCGLSDNYISKGPVSASRSVAKSLTEGPVAIYDVMDDPRVQYAEEAQKEGIISILSVPIYVRGTVIGAMRVYTAEHWEFTLDDVNFVQALAEIAGIVIDLTRMIEGQNAYIDILESLKDSREM